MTSTQTVFVGDCDLPLQRTISRLLSQVPSKSLADASPAADDLPTVTEPQFEVLGSRSQQCTRRTPTQTRMPAASTANGVADVYSGPNPPCPWLKLSVDGADKEALAAAVSRADILIFDVITDWEQAQWALELVQKQVQPDRPKTFILLSNVLTWAKTTIAPSEEGAEVPLTEEDFRKRKPHPKYKNQLQVEKLVMKAGAAKDDGAESPIRTFVINSGLVYHADDGLVHTYLRDAWTGCAELVCYGNGENTLPTIHITDLARIVVEVCMTPPDKKYILALDDGKYSVMQMLKAISENLGTGSVISVPSEEILLKSEWSQHEADMCLINVKMEPGITKNMAIEWKYETGIVENMAQFASEYKSYRDLKPLNVYITGPPMSGKTTLAKSLAAKYEIPYIDVDRITASAIDTMEKKTIHLQDELDAEIEAIKKLLSDLKAYATANEGRYPTEQVIGFVRDYLRSMPCRNHGYVLDGFGAQASDLQALFGSSGEEDEEKTVDSALVPGFVISLECSEDASKERYALLPSSALVGNNTEEAFLKRLELHHREGQEETQLMNFFDDNDIVPLVLSTQTTTAADCLKAAEAHIGSPRNYGPSHDELNRQKEREAIEAAKVAEQGKAEQVKREHQEQERVARLQAETKLKMEEVKKQELAALEVQSAPMRQYLVQNIMPSLTSGLIELCKVRPADPIDFLAEYLFRESEKYAVKDSGV